ncbi:uncharacterized protein F5891DRAFT_1171940 [Suillus fuscotomentosus]|uniref:F-box domain-containing protein n=1 Tax=Suillus fuscotomentosus TaxID=1912939 RepID=A0AAD4HLZ8_9AGAM|nr:uncharacterized protein F5891DRAFT_1171940 [Suillus fuscotomentosus]KAG1902595.1 hypothetical protein F5891DRAFT_1171940 [Suillus fuscotomentosus]
MTMAVGFLSLPTELICHILILLNPRDISRCALTCNIFWLVVRNSVHIQYKLEIYAQGLTSTGATTMNSTGISKKTLCSLKTLASLWRSDFHATTTFETVVAISVTEYIPFLPIQDVKCGLWWSCSLGEDKFYIQGCGTNPTLSRTFVGDFDGFLTTTFDPLQDLMVVCSEHHDDVTVTDAKQDYHVCWVEFRLASSQCPHPSAACTSLECKHTFYALPGHYRAAWSPPKICGDHVFILYYIENTADDCHPEHVPGMFIQVINWRGGYVNRHFLCQLRMCEIDLFYPVDEQKLVIIGPEGSIYLYTLQGPDGSPQCRIIYHLPKILHLSLYDSEPIFHGHPSLHGKAAHQGLMPSYVPSLESQIMVLEFLLKAGTYILVIDMAIFSDMALRSDMLVDIPWSDWGPQYAYYFPHHKSYHISVFGSKMAYALPQDHIPNPGQRLEGLSSEGYFYVHIWDFNKRVIARSECVNDPDSPDLRICKSGQMIDSFGEDIFSNAYIATVCCTPFPTAGSRIFLEQDRLTVTWVRVLRLNTVTV